MPHVPSPRSLTLAALAGCALVMAAAPAVAQVCQEGAKYIKERQEIVQQLNKAGGKDRKLDPRMACGSFGKLVANGEQSLKWLETNKHLAEVPS